MLWCQIHVTFAYLHVYVSKPLLPLPFSVKIFLQTDFTPRGIKVYPIKCHHSFWIGLAHPLQNKKCSYIFVSKLIIRIKYVKKVYFGNNIAAVKRSIAFHSRKSHITTLYVFPLNDNKTLKTYICFAVHILPQFTIYWKETVFFS